MFISNAATPADVSLLMQLGVDGVFVGSGIFKSGNPSKRAVAMVQVSRSSIFALTDTSFNRR